MMQLCNFNLSRSIKRECTMRKAQFILLPLWIWFFISVFQSRTLIRQHESSILKQKLRQIQNVKEIFADLWKNIGNPLSLRTVSVGEIFRICG